MSQRNINDIYESLTNSLVYLAKHGTEEQIKEATEIMEEGWKKMDEFDFNKEMAKLWRESHKEKSETKN